MTASEKAADARLRRVYKKTLEDKKREIAEQGGGCAICGRKYPEFILSQDHDHRCCPGKKSCGKCVRGMLCRFCNHALGNVKDNPETLRRMLHYLGWLL